jgi:predicted molibdopterin-dependent oxidoreductase YjgC
LKAKLNALSDSVPRQGEKDNLLLVVDRNPNSSGSKIMGISSEPMGSGLPKIRDGISSGAIRTLLVFGEDVTSHGIDANTLAKLDSLIVSDILPSRTTELAHYLLPGCAHLEKRGSFTNIKGRVQRFAKALEPKGESRAEWEFLHELLYNVTGQNGFVSIEGLFNQMAREVPALAGLTWAGLGDTGTPCQL